MSFSDFSAFPLEITTWTNCLMDRMTGSLSDFEDLILDRQVDGVMVMLDTREICTVTVLEQSYRISVNLPDWDLQTTYPCYENSDRCRCIYDVETAEDCTREVRRLLSRIQNQS